MGEIEVLHPGMLSSVQDTGREGYRCAGVPVSGAFDSVALSVGNRLLGNHLTDAAIEMTMIGGEYRFTGSTVVCLAGARADGAMVIDGDCRFPIPWYQPILIQSGSRIRVPRFVNGARAYLCVSGGIQSMPVLGSRSALVSLPDAGLGRMLYQGDRLDFVEAAASSPRIGGSPRDQISQYTQSIKKVLRIVEGAHTGLFTSIQREALGAMTFDTTDHSNRAGVRLAGSIISGECPKSIASEGTLPGYVQVPPSGYPIVLGVDGPTTGGYPVIASVIKADLPVLAQVAIREQIRFRWVDRQEAIEAYAEQQALIQSVQPIDPIRLPWVKSDA